MASQGPTFNELPTKKTSLLTDPHYWQSQCPCATITINETTTTTTTTKHFATENDKCPPNNNNDNTPLCDENTNPIQNHSTSFLSEGYTLIDILNTTTNSSSSPLHLRQLITTLSSAIQTLSNHSLPAPFVLLFDETWHLAKVASQYLTALTSPHNVLNYDILAWHIDASRGDAGFSPHRDRQPPTKELLGKSFHEDGHAKYLTLWLALSEAHTENSCLYVIPKRYDPGYGEGDDVDVDEEEEEEEDGKKRGGLDPLLRALPDKESFQNIRALPCHPGRGVIFTHRLTHWGSRGDPSCTEPRMAISFVASDPTFEKPYLANAGGVPRCW